MKVPETKTTMNELLLGSLTADQMSSSVLCRPQEVIDQIIQPGEVTIEEKGCEPKQR
jgi:hypothetical protein